MILAGVICMTTQIVRVGNTLAVELPEELLAGTGFSAGDSVEWVIVDGGGLTLVPSLTLIPDAGYDSELLQEIPGANDETGIIAKIHAGEADFAAGRFVPHERVMEWLDSWGTENELPVPECE
jgi:antitoxin component of MazEF toxin-antitoxin module